MRSTDEDPPVPIKKREDPAKSSAPTDYEYDFGDFGNEAAGADFDDAEASGAAPKRDDPATAPPFMFF